MSLTVTVAPKTTFSVERFEVSIICASASLCSRSRIRTSMWLWRSLAAWYSAFSLRSPWPLASSISLMFLGRSTFFNRSSSACKAAYPFFVIGIVTRTPRYGLPSRSPLRGCPLLLRCNGPWERARVRGSVILLQGLDGQLVLHADEHPPAHRQGGVGGTLRLQECGAEIVGETHDLAGGAHLRPEQHVGVGKLVEGEDGFLDGDVHRSPLGREADLLERPAHHRLHGELGQRHADRLADEGDGRSSRS